MSIPNPSDHLSIKNILSRYCEALDLKNFPLLQNVFTPDAIADYPFNSDLRGVEAISNAIQNRCVFHPIDHRMRINILIQPSVPQKPRTHPHAPQPHHTNHHIPPRRARRKRSNAFRWRAFWPGPARGQDVECVWSVCG
jgi:hypothetical protein